MGPVETSYTCNCSNCLVPAKKQRLTIATLEIIVKAQDQQIKECRNAIEAGLARVDAIAKRLDQMEDDLMRKDTEDATSEEEPEEQDPIINEEESPML